jgi:hypothetical protein
MLPKKMATTVNTLPALHRDRHEEVDKRNEKIQAEVSALVVVARGLQENIGGNVDGPRNLWLLERRFK